MVVLLDLDEDQIDEAHHAPTSVDLRTYRLTHNPKVVDEYPREQDVLHNPNLNSFSQALGCYPIVTLIAQRLDLNALHDLSRTCRQVRVNLLQYRRQLIHQTLRCENEGTGLGQRLADGLREMHETWNLRGPNGVQMRKLTSGKVGACARDMVGQCRRCSQVVCRNCIVKAPSLMALRGRHRRLCRTCIKSPLDEHTRCAVDECCQATDDSSPSNPNHRHSPVTVARDSCTCFEQVWICQPCGRSLRNNDDTYMRGWTWRTRYSTYLGGLGTGIGEGAEGVQCGRHSHCLAAKEVEKEIDCNADELRAERQLAAKAEMEGHSWGGSSYLMQEMEGIGGVVKRKIKKRVRVGAVVKEYEDERELGKYLEREQDGRNRSWCSWCDRVVVGKKDLEPSEGASLRRSVSRTSSSSSV